MILVSACLLGEKCRYDGEGNYSQSVVQELENKAFIGVCPEVAGGLGTPRMPAEIVGERILRADGTDVTLAFQTGVELCMQLLDQYSVHRAILKSRSPSCGVGEIYSGKFNGTLVPGDGLFTRALKLKNIPCQTEEEF